MIILFNFKTKFLSFSTTYTVLIMYCIDESLCFVCYTFINCIIFYVVKVVKALQKYFYTGHKKVPSSRI